MHDDTQVGRVVEMGRALKEGQFPVRWVSDLGYGYGYPIFNFYGPLPYYFGGVLYRFGLSGLDATKSMFIFGIVGSALAMYVATVSFLGITGAIIASLFYLYAPYHAVQIYVRGAVGEFWILIFWPIIFWSLSQTVKKNNILTIITLGGAAVAGSVLSHTLLGFATVAFLILGASIKSIFHRRVELYTFAMIAVGLGMSAFFWLPAFFEKIYTSVQSQIGSSANFLDHFVCMRQLWSSPWGFAGSAPGCVDGMSFAIGKVQILFTLGVIGYSIYKKLHSTFFWMAVAIFLLGVFLVLPVSIIVWTILPWFAYMQYPWRFLTLIMFGCSIVAGYLVTYIRSQTYKIVCAMCMIFLVMYVNVKWFSPQFIYQKAPKDFETAQELRWRVSKISDEYLPVQIRRPTEFSGVIFDTISQGVGVTSKTIHETATNRVYRITTAIATEIRVNIANFPGWKFFINDQPVHVSNADGIIILHVPSGVSRVAMYFTDTPIRTVGNLLSVTTIVFLILLYARKKSIVT
jgi:hypothetical protein